MTNVEMTPNAFKHHGDHMYGSHFGPIHRITPVALPGDGHHKHVHVSFKGSASCDFTPEDCQRLIDDLPAAVAALAVSPDCSAIAADVDLEGTA
jgi:hypothetical protein